MTEGKASREKSSVAERKFTVYIDPELKKAIKIAAIEDDMSASDLVTRAVDQYIKQRAGKKPAS